VTGSAEQGARDAALVDPVDLAAELIRIDSTNPDLVPGAAGEPAVAAYVAAWLRARGFDVRVLEEAPGRPTVLATARGTGGGRTILLDGHLDTVPPGDPERGGLVPRIEDGRLLGRGAFDMKAGLAAMMVAADRARRVGTRGDVVIACDPLHSRSSRTRSSAASAPRRRCGRWPPTACGSTAP
jgi:acetylornithine deacetylase/succinyl-diaminopimelate desuccinylase-like protein